MGKPKEYYSYWGWGRSSMRSVIPLSPRGEQRHGQTMGCMAHVLHHLFDFHMKAEEHNPQGLLPDQSDESHDDLFRKGVEAPRNSLEQEEGSFMAEPSSSSAIKDEEDLYIPFSIQIPPFRSRNAAFTSKPKSPSPSSPLPSSSPLQQNSPKTPNVVARLMGLDLLPPNAHISSAISSPSIRRLSTSSGRKSKGAMFTTRRHESGNRSVPDTAGMSSARRSNVEHRLSFQLNKENMTGTPPGLDFGMGSKDSSPAESSARTGKKESSRLRPVTGHDEITGGTMKKAGRRVLGADITNASLIGRCRGSSEGNQINTSPPDTNLKKARRNAREREETSPQVQTCKHFTTSAYPSPPTASSFTSSPRSRAQVDQVGKNVRVLTTMGSATGEDRSSKPLTSPPSKSHKQHKSSLPKLAVKCRKGNCEKYTTSRPPARRSSSLQPLHHEIVAPKQEKKLWQEETRVVPSEEEDPPGRLLPDSSEPSTRHAHGSSRTPTRLGHRCSTTGTGTLIQLQYLRTLLGLAGFSVDLPVSIAFLHSPIQALDPSLFDSLEQDGKHRDHDVSFCDLGTRPNRRLLFCLTNEIIGQLLRPHLRLKPCLPSSRGPLALSLLVPTGVELLDRTWARILAFPGADCKTLQDIDELVGSDIPDVGLDGDGMEEEWEDIAADLGRRILDFLVDEAATGLRNSRPAAAKFDPVDAFDKVTWDFT